MRITRDNFEAFLLDELEGNLTEDLRQELEVFMLANPDLNFNSSELPIIEANNALSGFEKEALKKRLPPAGFEVNELDDLLIAKLEGDLSKDQLSKLDKLINEDEAVALAWRQIQATKLTAYTVSYRDKKGLKKGGRIIPLFRISAIAASIALLLGMLWMFQGSDTVDHVAEESTEVSKENPVNSNSVKTIEPIKNASDELKKKLATKVQVDKQKSQPEKDRSVSSPKIRVEKKSTEPLNMQVAPRTTLATITTIKSKFTQSLSDQVPEEKFAMLPRFNDTVIDSPVEEFTVQELMASVVRNEVLDQEQEQHSELHGGDAVAMIDLGLDKISNGNAGLTVEKDDERRRWGIRLGSLNLEANLRQ